jgi:predicted RNA-binding protein with PUA-like domain
MKASTKNKHSYWMVKQEPETYSWDDFVKDGSTDWSGVRNYQARNNLRAMKPGDKVLFYHSGKGKEVVGLAEVVQGRVSRSDCRRSAVGCSRSKTY